MEIIGIAVVVVIVVGALVRRANSVEAADKAEAEAVAQMRHEAAMRLLSIVIEEERKEALPSKDEGSYYF
jgi:uncharacterized protein